MSTTLSPRLGIVILLVAASCFAANHLSARIAFDHGASVAAAVVVRATATALFLFTLMKVQGVAIAVPKALRGRALLAGLLIASQSYCLYSAVALIPPALALLVFQTSPMLYVLLSWALGAEKPRLSALPPMLLGLAGLVLREILVAQAEALHDARAEILQDHVAGEAQGFCKSNLF